MKLWKAWFDIRQRFVLCVVLVTLLMAPGAVRLAVSSARAAAAAETAGSTPEGGTPDMDDSFIGMMNEWIHGSAHGIFSALSIVLAVGGILSTGNARSNLMTLSLPAKRRQWLTAQASVAAVLLLALCAWEASIMVFTGWFVGLEVPVGRVSLAVFLTSLTAAIWIWPAILATAFTREAVRAALIVASLQVALQIILQTFQRQDLAFGGIANLQRWGEAVPWMPLLLGAIVAGGSAWWSLAKFQKMEF